MVEHPAPGKPSQTVWGTRGRGPRSGVRLRHGFLAGGGGGEGELDRVVGWFHGKRVGGGKSSMGLWADC